MPVLEYTKWQNFKTVLLKAQIACENSGYDPSDHFTDATKMVAIGSDAKREVEDMHLCAMPVISSSRMPIPQKRWSRLVKRISLYKRAVRNSRTQKR
jgi:hypothetical protein